MGGRRRVERQKDAHPPLFPKRKGGSDREALGLTVRLVAISAMLAAATLLIVASIVVLVTRSHLQDELDRELSASAQSFDRGPGQSVQTPADLIAESRRWLQVSAFGEDQVVAVRTQSGAVLSSESGPDLRTLPQGQRLLLATTVRWWDLGGSGVNIRALTVPIVFEGRQIGTLVCAASTAPMDATLAAVLSAIALASGAGLIVAALLGLATIRRTLAPLEQMSGEIYAIEQSGDLSRRAAQDGPMDEVGRLAAAFNRMLEKLQKAFSGQRRFLTDASHELRTPLTIARGQIELLESTIRTDDQHRSLALAMTELDRMGGIVEDLLLLARLDEGIPIALVRVEVELTMREALLRGMLLDARQARVYAEPDLFALADPEELLRVLTNLVANAIQHTPEGATITLRSQREGARAVIEIADSGPGIASHDLPHVFDRMYRGRGARTSSPGGAGLGLAIVKGLVQAMNGEVKISSTPAGTTVAVGLPLAPPAAPLPSAESPRDAGAAGRPSPSGQPQT